MFLGNTDVVVLFRDFLLQSFQSGATWHGCCNANNRFVLLTNFDHGITENILILRWLICFFRDTFPGFGIVRSGSMELFWMLNSSTEAFTFLSNYVNNYWLVTALCEFKRFYNKWQIMSVDRTEISDTKFFKDQTAAETATSIGIHCFFIMLEDSLCYGAF